ncbi:hypothetical protein K7X08_034696 [Anisodus acutangulus]|uniref:S phase cyclin A-associated protein in the endoplasmic reticulum N-terminal domain-containing protein n=1 Tax=Anisodus acutangulus TaxID=402998 RepID=A0A9Q1QZX4_9SOLA|nr:hypothetical protein K7X08_034696 [Anisodus acutangulus]
METNEGGDDQEGSGWMQVKKKHRNISKFSLHGWVGGSSQGTAPGHTDSQPSLAVKSEDLKSAVRHSKGSRPCIINDAVTSVSYEDAAIVHDKCVVSHGSTSVSSVFSTDSNQGISREHPQSINHEILPKIKWGDLDDRALTSHFGSPVQAEIKFGDIQNHDLLSRKTDQTNDSFARTSPTDLEQNRLVATTEDENHQILDSHPLSPNLKELSSEDVTAASPLSRGQCEHTQLEKGDTCKCPGEKVKCAAREGPSGVSMRNAKSEEACMEIPEVPTLDQNIKSVVVSQDSEPLSPTKGGSENIGQFCLASSNEEIRNKRVDSIIEDLSKTNSSSIDAEDTGESKERFRQRLWCFLFENLNRAVDELYLLCELECDLEQTKESILVLEEATSDFKELSSRVEEFERLKKTSSHATDGTPLTMKSNHRRPHALSWEVRRMTTSPHRAEILASSLEAFQKIQHERASLSATGVEEMGPSCYDQHCGSTSALKTFNEKGAKKSCSNESLEKSRKQSNALNPSQGNLSREKRHVDSGKSASHASRLPPKEGVSTFVSGKNKRDNDKNLKLMDHLKRHYERDEKRNGSSWRSMDAWKEKRNWEDVLSTPHRVSSRFSHSPGLSRKSAERARTLHDKLMSPEKKKKSAIDLKKEAEEKHARAMRIRTELENERVQKLQRTSEKLNRVSEWQTVRSMKLREVMYARHQRSESRHEAYLAEVVRRAGDESIKVNEVRFITSLNEENKKLILRQKLHDSQLRRAEKLQVLKTKQKEDMAREEAVLERKKLIEAEKLQRLAETQRKKEEAQVRREEERKASSAAREAKAMEQMRRKEVRAKAQQEEAELLAQKLAERLRESEQRRKIYLEQIRERASMDFRDQSSPFRRSVTKEGQGRSTPISNCEDNNENNVFAPEGSMLAATQHSLKRRIKKIRQRLMALKYDCPEPSISTENAGFVYRTAVANARVKIAKWLQELQRLRQARKEGAASFGLITAEIIKFLEGRDAELQASRQAGLVDFIASALPASHTSKPESCQVTVYLLRLLKAVLSAAVNRSYFLAQNLLPPVIPMLAAALETYIKIAASSNGSASANLVTCKASTERLELMSEVLDGFLWTAAAIIGHANMDERALQLQDGLIELVIAYQVIHRLRDLFALYDRPPVEGSPFPSSILLGVNLLAVLTSRFRNVSLVTCKNSPTVPTSRNKKNDIELAEAADLKSSPLSNSRNDGISVFPRVNGGVVLCLPDVPEDSPMDEFPKIKEHQGATVNDLSSDKVDSVAASMETADVLQESTSNMMYNNLQTDEKKSQDNSKGRIGGNGSVMKPAVKFLLSAISETGLVCLPSMLTAVLLQANNRCSEQQASYVLPSNFEDVATGVLKVLNNLALIDISFIQRMLARPDLKMEFFHLMSFLLPYCTSKWGTSTDQIGLLLLESSSLLGYFSLFHPENQAVLRWGKSPTILHKVCDLPFVFFSDPELMPVLAGTMVAACFGCEQNKDVIQQELSTDMLLALLKACRSSLPSVDSFTVPSNPLLDEAGASAQLGPESKSLQVDVPLKSNRNSQRNTRVLAQRGGPLPTTRTAKIRSLRENKVVKPCEGKSLKSHSSVPESTAAWMLHSRLSTDVLDKAEQFFAAVTCNENGEL